MIHAQIAARYIALNRTELCNRIGRFEVMGENEYAYQKTHNFKTGLTRNIKFCTFNIQTMKFLHQYSWNKKELLKVVYIEYDNGIPHNVITINDDYDPKKHEFAALDCWDFFCEGGDKNNLKAYNSGGGGFDFTIDICDYVIGANVVIWVAKGVQLIGEPENCTILEKPLRLSDGVKTSINPFKIAQIALSCEYCKVCECCHEEYCDEHTYEDDEGEMRYDHDDSLCNE